MARNNVQKYEGQGFHLEIGDGATPEVFTRVALINTNISAAWTKNTSEDSVADLDNFDAIYEIVRTIQSKDFSVEGAGKIDSRYFPLMMEIMEGERSNTPVNCKFRMRGENGFTITGPFVIDFTIDAPYKEVSTCQISAKKADSLTFTMNTP